MIGITIKELRNLLTVGHEVEFTYNGVTYVLRPEITDGRSYLVIWDCAPSGKCLCSYPIPEKGEIPAECLDAVLIDQCFGGKSFMEVESHITVDVIF